MAIRIERGFVPFLAATRALEEGGDLRSLVARVRELETKRDGLDRELSGLQPVPRLPRAIVKGRLDKWRERLRSSTTQARAVLQRVLDGRVTFTPRPKGDGYDFSAPTRFDRLFTGVVIPPPDGDYSDLVKHAGKGTERIDRRRDTLEGDYADVLERASEALTKAQKQTGKRKGKGVSSPRRTTVMYQPRELRIPLMA